MYHVSEELLQKIKKVLVNLNSDITICGEIVDISAFEKDQKEAEKLINILNINYLQIEK